MQVDYKELLEEIREITTVDGFVSSCLEIKESMFFYDRDLMLGAYSASLELLVVATLFSASLFGRRELNRVEGEVVACVDGLLTELAKYRLPLDVQYVVDRYLQEEGLQTNLRMPVYTQMMQNYLQSTEYEEENVDQLLQKAHHHLWNEDMDSEKEVHQILGRVGTKMLRGAHLRPIWLQISHPRIYLVLLGLQTMMNNFQVTPYYNFPFQDIMTERQKRKKIRGNVVLDLGVFRNFRSGGTGHTDLNVLLAKDDHDLFLEDLAAGKDFATVEPDGVIMNLLLIILENHLINEDVDDQQFIINILAYCQYWEIAEVEPFAKHLLKKDVYATGVEKTLAEARAT